MCIMASLVRATEYEHLQILMFTGKKLLPWLVGTGIVALAGRVTTYLGHMEPEELVPLIQGMQYSYSLHSGWTKFAFKILGT